MSHITQLLLLSLLPLSYIIVLIRELANNTFFISTNIYFYIFVAQIHSNVNIENNINIGSSRRRLQMLYINNSRDSYIISKASLKLYYKYMETQNDNPAWCN